MTAAAFGLELRLRARSVLLAGIGLMTVAAITGALFPAFGESLATSSCPRASATCSAAATSPRSPAG